MRDHERLSNRIGEPTAVDKDDLGQAAIPMVVLARRRRY